MAVPLVGILALQGDFEAHQKAFERAGARAVQVRTAEELEQVNALVIPGGESTSMLKLLRDENLFDPVLAFGERRPIFGTCAGAILLAARVSNPEQESFGLMDIDVERNAYGRQLDSCVARLDDTEDGPMEAVFIRAPVIRRVGPAARVLARYDGDPVLVEQGLHMAATFHPELTSDVRVHKLFLRKVVL